ncbi:hypothetical protein [Halomicrococcus sp. NG-SE-24]|uniref:hypothetical protein n=1 Tax=Halomicrococcus sp. NG-SE-24 TaxID=3436928 RepID=UPI003D95606F
MNSQRLTAVVLVFAVLLAGCTGFGGSTDGTDATSTTATTTNSTPTPTSTSTPTTTTVASTTSTTTTTTQTTEMWIRPTEPRTPFQNRLSDRISSVEFVDKKNASGGGYSDFDIRVTADTLMNNVDPESDGEPYFMVKINGTWITRKDVRWEQKKNGTYTLEVLPDALSQFDSGTLKVQVLLLEEDKKHDDKYDVWNGTIEYGAK